MVKYRKKPVVIEATPWWKHGDHPKVEAYHPTPDLGESQGAADMVWRCHAPCKGRTKDHGWIHTLEGGHIVCPGDFIITGVKGEHYPCKPDIFEQTYEVVGDG